jgi:hypothetical protein
MLARTNGIYRQRPESEWQSESKSAGDGDGLRSTAKKEQSRIQS